MKTTLNRLSLVVGITAIISLAWLTSGAADMSNIVGTSFATNNVHAYTCNGLRIESQYANDRDHTCVSELTAAERWPAAAAGTNSVGELFISYTKAYVAELVERNEEENFFPFRWMNRAMGRVFFDSIEGCGGWKYKTDEVMGEFELFDGCFVGPGFDSRYPTSSEGGLRQVDAVVVAVAFH